MCQYPRVTGYHDIDSHIYYQIEVDTKHTLQYRYSELLTIYNSLQRALKDSQISLPAFPSRHLFQKTNKSGKLIEQRQKQLENFMISLFKIPQLATLDIFRQAFLEGPIQRMSMTIKDYTVIGDTAAFYATITRGSQQWTYTTRYSDLRAIHDSLVEAKHTNLPQFPKRRIYTLLVDKTNEHDIQMRKQKLQAYFNQLFQRNDIMSTFLMRSYIQDTIKNAEREKQLALLREHNQKYRKSHQI